MATLHHVGLRHCAERGACDAASQTDQQFAVIVTKPFWSEVCGTKALEQVRNLMPETIENAAPATVLPLSLSRAFEHSREFLVSVNEYMDGSSQRGLLAATSRKRWRLAKRLTPAKMAELREFYEARKGPHETFYFYDPYETFPPFSHDPTGVALQGRYTVRFEGGWSQAMGLARGDVEIQLVEVV